MGKLPRTVTVLAAMALLGAIAPYGVAAPPDGYPASAAGVSAPEGGDEARPSVDADAVYYGDAKNFKQPAEVDADRVYAEIDEYKEILEQDLKPGDAKYAILLQKASRRFLKSVRAEARAAGHDLVARSGSVRGVDAVPDVTQSVIDRL